MKFLTALALALPFAYAKKVSYDGYKSYHIESDGDHESLFEALAGFKHVDLSCESHPDHVDVAIAPKDVEEFEKLGFNFTITSEDVGADIKEEGPFEPYVSTFKTKGAAAAAVPPISYFNSYHTLAEHEAFLADLQAAFPSNSRLFTVGNSVEGRAIRGIHLWGAARGKKAVIWHGNVHAREWLTAPTVEYLAYQLVLGYQNNDAVVRSTLDNYDFHILPIVNPDGFVYTQTNDRLWRKNRQVRSGQSCVGTDVNRNWPYQWVGAGSSTSPCSETYRGQAQGDTPENRALVSHINSLSGGTGIKWYVDWHSFSQLILLPFGYSCSARAANHETQMRLAAGVSSAIRGINGLSFTYGPTCQTIYQTNGGSLDWAHAVAGVELSWSYELRPTNSGGSGGFTVPATNILPSGREHWAGVRWLFQNW